MSVFSRFQSFFSSSILVSTTVCSTATSPRDGPWTSRNRERRTIWITPLVTQAGTSLRQSLTSGSPLRIVFVCSTTVLPGRGTELGEGPSRGGFTMANGSLLLLEGETTRNHQTESSGGTNGAAGSPT